MGGAEPSRPARADVAGYQALRGQAARMAAMAELSRELAEIVPDLERVAKVVVRRTAESLHDPCALHLADGDASGPGRVAVHDPHQTDGERRTAALVSLMEGGVGTEEGGPARPPVLGMPRRVWLPAPDDAQLEAMLGPGWAAYGRDVGVSSLIAAPLRVRDRHLGVIVCLRPVGAYSAADAAYVQELADRAALAIDNGQLYAAATNELSERRRVEADLRARAVQQAAVAELSQRALARVEPAELMQQAVEAVAGSLGVPLVGLAEMDDERSELVLRAGVGWREDAMGAPLTGELAARSLGNLVLAAEEPVVIEDVATETRVAFSETLRRHGVTSAACVPVIGSRVQLGVLGTFDVVARSFSPDDVHFLQTIANVIAMAVDRHGQDTEIRYLALHDSLTGLPNRVLLADRLEREVQAFRRTGRAVALLLMDLDGFKDINDTLGHHVGDVVLTRIGARLTEVVRQTDTVARLGGDEFAIVLSDVEPGEAERVAVKLLAAVEEPLEVEDMGLGVRASVGIALVPDHGTDTSTLLRCADVAMYRAKQLGMGSLTYDADFDHHDVRRLALVAELREALEADELVCHYQPIIDLRDRELTSVEALVRWRHPVLGLVGPEQFVPVAEQTGLIKPLTWWVLRSALTQVRLWEDQHHPLAVAVNISACVLHDPELVDRVHQLLSEAGVAGERLELEITESGMMANPGAAMETLTRLAALGIRLAIDDFGTGYSSLAYLQRLPVHDIKVDRSFVADMADNSTDASIVRSVIELGHSLGLRVTAIGVEDEPTLDLLTELGCDAIQGYLVGVPALPGELGRRAGPEAAGF
jgi:diguanylate cyclase (GGDEF)-like protein